MAIGRRLQSQVTDNGYEAHRLTVAVNAPYDDFRQRYEQAVPRLRRWRLLLQVARKADWSAVTSQTNASAPHGFLRYWRSDVRPLMSLAGVPTPCSIYLMGNHIVAEKMFRNNPTVMVCVPMQTVITVDSDGGTTFSIEQPSRALATFGSPDIASVGVELDRKVAALLQHLGAPVPPSLLAS
jgi:hypothetical protein